MEQKETLSARQLRVIAALLDSPSVSVACKKARVARKTVYEWMKQPAFLDELRSRRELVLEQIVNSLAAKHEIALNRLDRLMISAESEHVQLRAILGCLELVLRYNDQRDLDRRLKAIEEVYYERKQFGTD